MIRYNYHYDYYGLFNNNLIIFNIIVFILLEFLIYYLNILIIARNTPNTQKLIRNREIYKLYENKPSSNYIENNWGKKTLQFEQNDERWDSISMQKENTYIHEFPSVNFTYNNTRNNRILYVLISFTFFIYFII